MWWWSATDWFYSILTICWAAGGSDIVMGELCDNFLEHVFTQANNNPWKAKCSSNDPWKAKCSFCMFINLVRVYCAATDVPVKLVYIWTVCNRGVRLFGPPFCTWWIFFYVFLIPVNCCNVLKVRLYASASRYKIRSMPKQKHHPKLSDQFAAAFCLSVCLLMCKSVWFL